MENSKHQHYVAKVVVAGDNINIQMIGEAMPGLTGKDKSGAEDQMFSTQNFQGQSFCHVLAVDGGEDYRCEHSSLKMITVTQEAKCCPHEYSALALHCYCQGGKEKFEEERVSSDCKTALKMEYYIRMSDNKYVVSASTDGDSWGSEYKINHKKLCEYNGAIRLGPIKQRYPCCQNENEHCAAFKRIHIKADEVEGKEEEDPKEDSSRLECKVCQEESNDQPHKTNNTGKVIHIACS